MTQCIDNLYTGGVFNAFFAVLEVSEIGFCAIAKPVSVMHKTMKKLTVVTYYFFSSILQTLLERFFNLDHLIHLLQSFKAHTWNINLFGLCFKCLNS